MIASASSRCFSMSSRVSPSTLRRKSGSVLEGRTFIHQSGYEIVEPVGWQIRSWRAVEMIDRCVAVMLLEFFELRRDVVNSAVDLSRAEPVVERRNDRAHRFLRVAEDFQAL